MCASRPCFTVLIMIFLCLTNGIPIPVTQASVTPASIPQTPVAPAPQAPAPVPAANSATIPALKADTTSSPQLAGENQNCNLSKGGTACSTELICKDTSFFLFPSNYVCVPKVGKKGARCGSSSTAPTCENGVQCKSVGFWQSLFFRKYCQ